jgi:hypothetical protein
MKRSALLLAVTAAAALLAGCADTKIRVVGDRPADILLTQDLPANRGDPKYIGRVDPSAGGAAVQPANEAPAATAPFVYEYVIPDPLRTYGLVVVVRTREGDWLYPVDPAFVKPGETITIRYPPADSAAQPTRVAPLPANAPAPSNAARAVPASPLAKEQAAATPVPAGANK